MKPVPTWKTAVLIWLGIYPTITTVIWLLSPINSNWPLPLRTLSLTLVVVPVMAWVMLPFLRKLLKNWLNA